MTNKLTPENIAALAENVLANVEALKQLDVPSASRSAYQEGVKFLNKAGECFVAAALNGAGETNG